LLRQAYPSIMPATYLEGPLGGYLTESATADHGGSDDAGPGDDTGIKIKIRSPRAARVAHG